MSITTCIFDAYGTLFDVNAAARIAAQEPGREAFAAVWPDLAEAWRRKQLEYSWLRAITGEHTDFWTVTQDGLDWAMEVCGQSDPDLRERLLQLYFELDAYPEVPDMLRDLRNRGMKTAILSNGSPKMLEGAVNSAGIGALLDDVLSVESVGVFKPASAVYDLVGARFGTDPSQVLFASSNGWDAAAASAYGFFTVWVNRRGDPVDRMPGRPSLVVSDLSDVSNLKEI